MNWLKLIPNDPAVLASITVGQLLSIPFVKAKFSDKLVSSLQEHQLTMTLDKLEPAFLFLLLKDFLQNQKDRTEQLSDNIVGRHDITECPFCKHTFFLGD